MPENLSLFPDPELAFKEKLGPRLKALAARQLFLGASSWKYPGWLGQIYSRERYSYHGRFSKPRFQQECLSEYAEVFPVVCGDFAFYQFPTPHFWAKLFSTAPETLQFAFKVPEEITIPFFPKHPRYSTRAGLPNPNFLNADLFGSEFLRLLSPYSKQVALLIFEFGPSTGVSLSPQDFSAALAAFFSLLPQNFRFAVEIRNSELLAPSYLHVLSKLGIAHVFNSWTHMPPLTAQLLHPDAFTANFTVSRALLRPGRKYADAVNMFAPYSETQDVNHEVRDALLHLLLRAKSRAEPTYLFINNRLEGNAPNTIYALTEALDSSTG